MPLSSKQMEYLATAWMCFESEPKIDFTKFAELAGLKNAASARELMRVTKNKLRAEHGNLSGGLQAANANTSTPKKASTKKTTGEADSACGSENGTPAVSTTKKRTRTPSKKVMEAEAEVEDSVGEESPTKKARSVVVKRETVGDEGDLDDMFQ